MAAKARILIVDDDHDMVAALRLILESASYAVSAACSGAEGMAKARMEKPDLVILDIMLENEYTGLFVCKELRNDKDLKAVPVLLLSAVRKKTGTLSPPDIAADVLPVDDFAEKPIEPADLIRRVEKLLKRQGG